MHSLQKVWLHLSRVTFGSRGGSRHMEHLSDSSAVGFLVVVLSDLLSSGLVSHVSSLK